MAVTTGQPGPEPSTIEFPEGGEGATTGSIWRLILDVFVQNRLAVLGLGIIVFMVLFCFAGPLVYHTDQVHTNLSQVTLPPSAAHPLGTDDVGYDVLGRLMLGGQSSIEVGLAAAILASLFGTAWGALSGFIGGWVDAVMMRVVDSFLAIPYLLLALLLASVFTPSITVMIIIIALISWLITARLVRGETLSLRIRDYVQAARAVGSKRWRIVLRHIVPNAVGTIVVQTTFEVANAILLLAILSYLGLGPPPPAANWGGMLTNGLNYVYDGY
ncbi:MAG TPA: ABC transporter permease, partial [Acidimicrobiales bacterium]|nr:ABC transporter permease [Acidimicrobiales bacterium]